MTLYQGILFLHFLGMLALFVGYGLEWTASAFLPQSTTGDQARQALRLYRLSLPLSGPGLLLLIFTGGYLASLGLGMKPAWISATFLGIVIALGIGFGLILPRIKAIRGSLPEGPAALPGEVLLRVRNPVFPTLVRARFGLALGIVYLMTAKTDSLPLAILIIFVAAALGALFAAPAWSKPAART
jgi:hypothetical protein